MNWSAAAEARERAQSSSSLGGSSAVFDPTVSFFSSSYENLPDRDIKVSEFLDSIRGGRHKRQVMAIQERYSRALDRTGGDHEAAKKIIGTLKKRLCGITLSGVFSVRAADKLVTHTNLMQGDLDLLGQRKAEVRAALESDPHVFFSFESTSGDGLKAAYRVPPCATAQEHKAAHAAVAAHVKALCGVEIDATSDVSRLCYASWDPNLYHNPDAVELPVDKSAVPAEQEGKSSKSGDGQRTADATERQRIAEEILGPVQWEDGETGFCECPGKARHTNADGPKDCKVFVGTVPTIKCMHLSCAGVVSGVNHELRSRVGKAEAIGGTIFGRRGSRAEYLPGGADQDEPEPVVTAPEWPQPLAPAAFHGLAGDVVRAIDPHTEADPAAVLVMFLAAFGNLVGATAHFMAEARRHFPRIWPVLVGETAKGRKGSAWSSLRFVLDMVCAEWLERCTASGLSSGEGLVYCVRDPVVRRKKDKDGTVEECVVDEGVEDKRLLTIEEEFGSVLKVAARDGCTISDMMRRAWDTGDLRNLTKNQALRATGAHVTVVGHITRSDLSRLMADGDALNGFGNRFVWCAVKRSKLLPEGGELHHADLAPLVYGLRTAADFARTATLVRRSEEARVLWRDIYPTLAADRGGLFGAITNRAEAQVMRLALIYALLDCSPQIEVVHLRAALALWDYCDRSARFIFGEALGDKAADRILDELRCAGSRGLTRNNIRAVFGNNLSTAKMDSALGLLSRLHLANWTKEPSQGAAGRPAIVWRATRVQQAPECPLPSVSVSVAAPVSRTKTAGLSEPAGVGQPTPEAQPELEPESQPVAAGDTELF